MKHPWIVALAVAAVVVGPIFLPALVRAILN